jgi:hypothetical protein
MDRHVHGILKFLYRDLSQDITFEFKLYDLKGLGPGGLVDLARANSFEKLDILNDYKSNMDLALKERQSDFFKYAMNDCILLPKIHQSNIRSYNNILSEKKIPIEGHFTTQTMPLTVGSIVHNIWDKKMRYNIFKNNTLIRLAMAKMGVLNNMSGFVDLSRESLAILKKYKSLDDLSKAPQIELEKLEKNLLHREALIYQVFQYSSVPYIISEAKKFYY